MTVGMEFNISRDRVPDLTMSQININPRLQPTTKTVSATIVIPHIRAPLSARSKKLEPTIRAAITRRTAMRLLDRISSRLSTTCSCACAACFSACLRSVMFLPHPTIYLGRPNSSRKFLGPAELFPQEARLVLYPKVVAVLGSKPVLLHQVALGHQDRRFRDSGLLVVGMQTVDPPVR